jgi:hypothetical protein
MNEVSSKRFNAYIKHALCLLRTKNLFLTVTRSFSPNFLKSTFITYKLVTIYRFFTIRIKGNLLL